MSTGEGNKPPTFVTGSSNLQDQDLCNPYSGAIPSCRFYVFNSSPSLGTLKADYTRYRPVHEVVLSLLQGA